MIRKKSKLKPYTAVLDIGTSKVCCLIFRLDVDEKPEVVGMGYAPAKGIKAGAIVDMDQAHACIAAVLAQAEKQADRQIEKVVVNISSTQMKSYHVYKEIEISDGNPISALDVKRLVDSVIADHLSAGYEIIHAFPLGYVVDKEQGVSDPRGLYGYHLGVYMHLIALPESQARNLVAVLDSCHVAIEEKVATPYAAALAILSEEEKEAGVSVIDMGAGTTHIAMFLGGSLMHLGLIPGGGNAITRDIEQGLNTPPADAERLKTLNGAAFVSPRDSIERLIVPVLGEEGTTIHVARSDLISIIEPRIEEMLTQIGTFLNEEPRLAMAARRIVLTGGGSELQGIKDKTAAMLGVNTRLGKVSFVKGLPTHFDSHAFSTCIGLLKYAMIKHQNNMPVERSTTKVSRKNLLGRMIQWLVQNF